MAGYELPKVGSVWRHYNGNTYVVKEIVYYKNSNELGVLYTETVNRRKHPWVRPLREWYQMVEDEDGFWVPRFEEELDNKNMAERAHSTGLLTSVLAPILDSDS